ncbi:hypothetical protein DFH06DRAFT_982765 [Mycena polygramma]|nr:hypothetical protein DFH06DRAFT_982765 [Mycena polygramma]
MEQLFSCVLERNLLVPLYFCWGAIDAEPRAFIPRILKETHLFPDHHEVAHLSQSPGRVGFSRWEWREEPLPQPQSGYQRFCFPLRPPAESTALAAITGPSVPTASRSCPPCDLSAARDEHRIFPPVEHYSGQKEGEDMHTYFARRAERNKKWAGSEKLDARSSRLARETYAAKGGPPSKKAARVFVWEEEAGFLIRRSVNYTNAADMWDDYSPKQRRYDGFSDEWDLCHEFAPEEDWGADDDDKGYKGYTDPHSNDLREIYDLDDTSYGLEDVDEAHPDMAEIPRFRFGFTQPIAPARYQEALRADFLARAVGDEKWPDLRLPKYSLLSVLLAYLLKAKSIQDVPRELLDLRQEGAEIMGHWAVDVRQELLNNQLFYVISLPDTNVHILLQSAATVLQIVRMGWGASSGINEIVAELLARGVQFRLCFQAPLYREPLYQLRQTGLGFRPVGYRPTLVDYVAYQQRLQAFLHSPRGRAALCAGGIIGRLARARVPDDLVLLGPSDEAFQTGVRLWDRRKQTAYWDDALSADDIDLICGVYVTGMV